MALDDRVRPNNWLVQSTVWLPNVSRVAQQPQAPSTNLALENWEMASQVQLYDDEDRSESIRAASGLSSVCVAARCAASTLPLHAETSSSQVSSSSCAWARSSKAACRQWQMWFVVSWLAMFAWATPCVSQCAKHYTSLSACTACLVGCTLKSCRPRFAFALRSHALAAVASDALMPSASSQHCTAVLQSCNTPPAQHNTGSIHIQSVIDGCMCAALRCLILWRVNVSDRPQSPCTPCALLPC